MQSNELTFSTVEQKMTYNLVVDNVQRLGSLFSNNPLSFIDYRDNLGELFAEDSLMLTLYNSLGYDESFAADDVPNPVNPGMAAANTLSFAIALKSSLDHMPGKNTSFDEQSLAKFLATADAPHQKFVQTLLDNSQDLKKDIITNGLLRIRDILNSADEEKDAVFKIDAIKDIFSDDYIFTATDKAVLFKEASRLIDELAPELKTVKRATDSFKPWTDTAWAQTWREIRNDTVQKFLAENKTSLETLQNLLQDPRTSPQDVAKAYEDLVHIQKNLKLAKTQELFVGSYPNHEKSKTIAIREIKALEKLASQIYDAGLALVETVLQTVPGDSQWSYAGTTMVINNDTVVAAVQPSVGDEIEEVQPPVESKTEVESDSVESEKPEVQAPPSGEVVAEAVVAAVQSSVGDETEVESDSVESEKPEVQAPPSKEVAVEAVAVVTSAQSPVVDRTEVAVEETVTDVEAEAGMSNSIMPEDLISETFSVTGILNSIHSMFFSGEPAVVDAYSPSDDSSDDFTYDSNENNEKNLSS